MGPVAVSAKDGAHYHGVKEPQGLMKVEKTLLQVFSFAWRYLKVGDKDSDLFIDYADWDWCWRSNVVAGIFVDTELAMAHAG